MTITLTCNRCGASIKSESVLEALAWDDTHDDVCTKPIDPSNERQSSPKFDDPQPRDPS